MHRLFRRSSLLKRYVVYNLCFVLIPLLLLIYIYWQSALSQFIDEYETTHRYTLTQVMRSLRPIRTMR